MTSRRRVNLDGEDFPASYYPADAIGQTIGVTNRVGVYGASVDNDKAVVAEVTAMFSESGKHLFRVAVTKTLYLSNPLATRPSSAQGPRCMCWPERERDYSTYAFLLVVLGGADVFLERGAVRVFVPSYRQSATRLCSQDSPPRKCVPSLAFPPSRSRPSSQSRLSRACASRTRFRRSRARSSLS